MTIKEEKRMLRSRMRERAKALQPEYTESADASIFQNLTGLDLYKKAETIFCYVGRTDEINTSLIICHALEHGKCVMVPRCEERGIMHAYEIHSMGDLVEGSYGILEPARHCLKIEPVQGQMKPNQEGTWLAIVPCLGATHCGHRLGYGGGYYDRYLKDIKGPKILLCREQMILEAIPQEEHDLVIETVVTEDGIFDNKA